MNILIAADYATPSSGSFIGSMMELALRLKASGDGICFVFPANGNTTSETSWTHWLEREGFSVALVEKSTSEREQLEFLRKIIDDNHIDILHIHYGLFHHLALHHRRELPVRIVVHEHMEYPAGCNRSWQTLRYIVRSALYRINAISIVSVNREVDRAHFLARHYYIPNGLTFRRNLTRSLSREERRAQIGIPDEEKLVLFLGWYCHTKGLDIAVRAVQECRNRGRNVTLGIIGLGQGQTVKNDRKAYIYSQTQISPDEEWIRYLGG